MPISTWSVISVTIEIHKRPGRAECHPVSTFVNLLLWHVVLNIGPNRRKNTRQSTIHFCLHFTISGGDTFSCYLPKLIFSFTFLPLPFIQPSFSSCLLFFFLWIFLLASPPTDIWACNWSSFCLFARLSHFVFIVLFLACLSWSPDFYILFSAFIVFDWCRSLFLPFYLRFISVI